jgi:glycosyltransferase involved in cell wall biosynthesis
MKKVIVVAPHFPPSNLVGVHRGRFLAQHLPDFGWEPILVTVHHDYYEESLDWNLARLLPDDLRIERVGALPTEPVRLVGNIAVRGFVPLLRRILQIIDREDVDFLYISIAGFVTLLGRAVHELRGVPYGIDYQDPWVQPAWHPDEHLLNRHWWARKLADVAEPVAVKKAALITGVAPDYYKDVLARNPHLKEQAVTAAAPIGGEARDHRKVKEMDLQPYLFDRKNDTFDLVYAGALLPKAYEPLKRVLRAIAGARQQFADVRFHFIGTGKTPDDPDGYNVRPLAEEYGLWQDVIFEYPARIPYLDALVHQEAADAVFVLGSTEPHYTPSKVYQGVLAQKPLLTVLHRASTACEVVRSTGAGQVLDFDGAAGLDDIETRFADVFDGFRDFAETFAPEQVDRDRFDEYSAWNVTQTLAGALDRAVGGA